MTPDERDQHYLRDPAVLAEEIVSRHGPFSTATRAGLIDAIELTIGCRDYAIRNAVGSDEPLAEWRDRLREPAVDPCFTCGHGRAYHHKLRCEHPNCVDCNGYQKARA